MSDEYVEKVIGKKLAYTSNEYNEINSSRLDIVNI